MYHWYHVLRTLILLALWERTFTKNHYTREDTMTTSNEETAITTIGTTMNGGTTTEEAIITTTTTVEMAVEAAPVSPEGETAMDTKKRESPDTDPAGQPEAKKITIESSKEEDHSKEEEKALEEKPSEEADSSAENKPSEDTPEKAVDKEEDHDAPLDEKDENDKPEAVKKLGEAAEEPKPVMVEQ